MDNKHLELVHSSNKIKKETKKKPTLMEREILESVVELYQEKHELELKRFKTGPYYSKAVFASAEGWEFTVKIERTVEELFIEFNGSKLEEYQRIIASDVVWSIIHNSRFKHKDTEWGIGDYCITEEEEYQLRLDEDYIQSLASTWNELYDEMVEQINDNQIQFYIEEQGIEDVQLYVTGDDGVILCKLLEEEGILTFAKVDTNLYELTLVEEFDEEDIKNMKIIFSNYLRMNGYNSFVRYQ